MASDFEILTQIPADVSGKDWHTDGTPENFFVAAVPYQLNDQCVENDSTAGFELGRCETGRPSSSAVVDFINDKTGDVYVVMSDGKVLHTQLEPKLTPSFWSSLPEGQDYGTPKPDSSAAHIIAYANSMQNHENETEKLRAYVYARTLADAIDGHDRVKNDDLVEALKYFAGTESRYQFAFEEIQSPRVLEELYRKVEDGYGFPPVVQTRLRKHCLDVIQTTHDASLLLLVLEQPEPTEKDMIRSAIAGTKTVEDALLLYQNSHAYVNRQEFAEPALRKAWELDQANPSGWDSIRIYDAVGFNESHFEYEKEIQTQAFAKALTITRSSYNFFNAAWVLDHTTDPGIQMEMVDQIIAAEKRSPKNNATLLVLSRDKKLPVGARDKINDAQLEIAETNQSVNGIVMAVALDSRDTAKQQRALKVIFNDPDQHSLHPGGGIGMHGEMGEDPAIPNFTYVMSNARVGQIPTQPILNTALSCIDDNHAKLALDFLSYTNSYTDVSLTPDEKTKLVQAILSAARKNANADLAEQLFKATSDVDIGYQALTAYIELKESTFESDDSVALDFLKNQENRRFAAQVGQMYLDNTFWDSDNLAQWVEANKTEPKETTHQRVITVE